MFAAIPLWNFLYKWYNWLHKFLSPAPLILLFSHLSTLVHFLLLPFSFPSPCVFPSICAYLVFCVPLCVPLPFVFVFCLRLFISLCHTSHSVCVLSLVFLSLSLRLSMGLVFFCLCLLNFFDSVSVSMSVSCLSLSLSLSYLCIVSLLCKTDCTIKYGLWRRAERNFRDVCKSRVKSMEGKSFCSGNLWKMIIHDGTGPSDIRIKEQMFCICISLHTEERRV